MRQKLRQGPSGLPRGSPAAERRPVSADATSWALHLAPVPAGCGGQPSTACKFRARRPSRPRRAGQHAPVLLRRWLTCQLIWPSLYRGHRVCKLTNLAGGHESRLTPIQRARSLGRCVAHRLHNAWFCWGCAELRMTFTAAGSIGGRRCVSRRRRRCVAESGPGAKLAPSARQVFLVAQRPSDLSCAGAGQDGVGNGLNVSRVGAAAATEDGDLWMLGPQLHVIAG